MTSQSSVEQFLAQRHLGLVGVSRSGKKFGNTVLRELTKKGYLVSVVHPQAAETDGVRCYSSVSALPEEVGGLVLVVPPEQTETVVREAAARGMRRIWMQQGSESPAAIEYCRENGIEVVHGECILMFAQPTGFHRFHRWLWGLLGKLPAAAAGLVLLGAAVAALASEQGPSFDCSGAAAGSIESFWEHHGEATLTWGYDAPELHCTVVEAGG